MRAFKEALLRFYQRYVFPVLFGTLLLAIAYAGLLQWAGLFCGPPRQADLTGDYDPGEPPPNAR